MSQDSFQPRYGATQTAVAEQEYAPVDGGAGSPESGSRSNATRYLCAAAHLDERFRSKVLREVLEHRHRAVAPSYGFDLRPVLAHCLAADRRAIGRDALLTLIAVVSLIFAFSATITTLINVAIVGVLVRLLTPRFGRRLSLRTAGTLLVVLVLLAWVVVIPWLISVAQQIALPDFNSPDGFTSSDGFTSPDEFSQPPSFVSDFSLGLLFVAILWLVLTGVRLQTHNTLVNTLRAGRFNPRRVPPLNHTQEERVSYIDEAQHGNLTIYAESRADRPFVGSGWVVESWSLALPLVPDQQSADPGRQQRPLTPDVLHTELRERIADLADPRLPADQRVSGLRIEDRVFLAGVLSADHPGVDRRTRSPVYRLTRDEIRDVMHRERGALRHYQSVRVLSWEGELAVTVFAHFGLEGHLLVIEFVATVLPGILPEYRAVDQLDRLSLFSGSAIAAKALIELPFVLAKAPINLGRAATRAVTSVLAGEREQQRAASQLAYDYGARFSVRELAAIAPERVYFQFSDALRHIGVVERRATDAIAELLREHGYSDSEFRRKSEIYAQNFFTGNTFNNSAFATGQGGVAKTVNSALQRNLHT
jgi:hypothetical protein